MAQRSPTWEEVKAQLKEMLSKGSPGHTHAMLGECAGCNFEKSLTFYQLTDAQQQLRALKDLWYENDEGVEYCRGCGISRDTSDKRETRHTAGKVPYYGCVVELMERSLEGAKP
jgi:hypothetical protein